jgi:tRNA A37 threonylcarbamoyladenosine dehydratase
LLGFNFLFSILKSRQLTLRSLYIFFSFLSIHKKKKMSHSVLDNVSNFLERHQQGARLTLTAIAASILTASTLLSYQKITRSRLAEDKSAIKRALDEESRPIAIIDEEKEQLAKKEAMDESLVLELLARNIAFFGAEQVSKIRQSFVVVLGAGAVGSWTALMMLRSGVEHIRVVDRGLVRLESMTRHAVAKISDIGQSKALVMKRYMADVAPHADVEAVREELTADNLAALLAGNPDFVVDTLPNVREKVLLAKYCKEHDIKIVSASSAGAKADPTMIQLTDVSDTVEDPLARMYRRQLRKFDIDRGIPVVHSIEKSVHTTKGNKNKCLDSTLMGRLIFWFSA